MFILRSGRDASNTDPTRSGPECCVDILGNPQYLRGIQAYSGGAKLDAKLQSNTKIPNKWTTFLYHNGSSYDHKSMVEGGLVARRISNQQRRQACFFTPVDAIKYPNVYSTSRRKRNTNESMQNQMEFKVKRIQCSCSS